MKNPRSTRDRLPLPAYEQLLAYLGDVRAAALDYLATADLEGNDPLLRDGYLYRMILQHEDPHDETILATRQLKRGEHYHPLRRRDLPAGDPSVGGMVAVPAGEFLMGTDDRSTAY